MHFLVLLPQTRNLKLEMALRVFSITILIIKKNHRTSNTVTHLHEEVIFFFDLLEIWVINASLHATSVLVPSRNNFL